MEIMKFLKFAFISAYTICKIPFNDINNTYLKRIVQPILVILAVLLILITCLIVIPFACYRGSIYLYLRFKYGRKFIKILNFLSTTFCFPNHATIRYMIYIMCDDVNTLETDVRDSIQAMIRNVPELSGIVKYCWGYYYLLKRNVGVGDVFSVVSLDDSKRLTEDKLCHYLRECELPRGELFQVKLLRDPLEGSRYVLLYLLDHVIVDGYSIRRISNDYIFDKQIIALTREFRSESEKRFKLDDLYISARCFKGTLTNGLPMQSKGPDFAIFIENDISCVPKLRMLRKKFGCTFNEIMMAILTNSLCQYMKRQLGDCSKVITICCVYHIHLDYEQSFRDGHFSRNHVNNNTFLLLFHVEDLARYQSFDDFVEHIRSRSQEAVRSTALQISYVISTGVLEFVPEVLYRKYFVYQQSRPALVFSNVGFHRSVTFRGRQVTSVFATMPTLGSGLFASFLSFDEKLHITLASKLPFLTSRNDLQDILDNAVALIHDLYKGVNAGAFSKV